MDYTVISELRDVLRQFKLQDVQLIFSRLQVWLSCILGQNSVFITTQPKEYNVILCVFHTHLQPSVLEVLLAADLEGLRYTHSVEAALLLVESGNLLDDWHRNCPITVWRQNVWCWTVHSVAIPLITVMIKEVKLPPFTGSLLPSDQVTLLWIWLCNLPDYNTK